MSTKTKKPTLRVKSEGEVLKRTKLIFENQAVLNPACIEVDGITHMFYRAVHKKNMRSTIGYCHLVDGKVIKRFNHPILQPEYDYEFYGLEDPRIVFLNDTYYMFYSVYNGKNVQVSYATATELPHFTKHEIISADITYREIKKIFAANPSKTGKQYLQYKTNFIYNIRDAQKFWQKNMFLFPKKINGKFAFVHRIQPGMHILYVDSLKKLNKTFWKKYLAEVDKHILFYPKYEFENHHISGGCPPIETKDGWLFIYHAVQRKKTGLEYHACAALLDLKNPQKVIGRLDKPLFSPKEPWEITGDVNNVVFPTGTTIKDGRLYIYYGAADKAIGLKTVNLQSLIDALKS